MAKAYWVQTYRSSAKDVEAYEAYRKLAAPALTAAGGRYLVRNKPAKTYEAGINGRVILIEFDSLEKAIAAHNTPPTRKRSRYSVLEMSSATYAWWKANDRW